MSLEATVQVSPTSTVTALLRGGSGAFDAPRGGGNKHAGVDIVANQSSLDKEIYRVLATAKGVVAYARLNGTDETGYGYTVVIDHGNGFYTQYSHLATTPSRGIVSKGDAVAKGQLIGYLADLTIPELSSGNVRSDVVADFDKIQLHFEVFNAPVGRTSDGALSILKQNGFFVDPTARLLALGYQSF